MQKHILFIIGSLDLGGAEQHLTRKIIALKKSGFDVALFLLHGEGILTKRLEAEKIAIYKPMNLNLLNNLWKPLRILIFLLLSWVRLSFTCLKLRPAIINMYLPLSYIVGMPIALLLGLKIKILSRRSLNKYQEKQPFVCKLETFFHKKVDLAIGNSNAVAKELLIEGIEPRKVLTIRNGTEVIERVRSPNRKSIREFSQIPDNSLLIINVANVIQYKGHEDIIQAFAILQKQINYSMFLVFLGFEHKYAARMRELSVELNIADNIIWLGQKENIYQYLLSSDIGILASHEEGFSNALLEKMMCGLPVVATSVGGNVDAIACGESGLLVEPKNANQLAQALKRLVCDQNYRRVLGSNARKTAKRKFSIDREHQDYIQLYRRLLSEN